MTKPSVVLLHGLGGAADWWRHNLDALAAAGFSPSALDFRVEAPFDEAATVLAERIGGPAHVVGNSMGGQLAIHLAAIRPDLVRSLTLVSSTGLPFHPGRHVRNALTLTGLASMALMIRHDLFRNPPFAIARGLRRLMRDDVRPLLRRLRLPVLLLWGDRDPLVPLVYANEVLAEVPHAELVVVPRAGHMPMWENAPAFNDALIAFFSKTDAKGL